MGSNTQLDADSTHSPKRCFVSQILLYNNCGLYKLKVYAATMFRVALFVLAVLAHSMAEKPAFCQDSDCPSYTTKESTDDYELREYAPSKWVQTAMTGVEHEIASMQMFGKLFRYIGGNNAANKKIDMTRPVIGLVIPRDGSGAEKNFTMAFYMPESNVPAPSAPDIKIMSIPAMHVYVKSFPGYASLTKYIWNAKLLEMKLKDEKKPFISNYFYKAGYNSPFEFTDRHNEVWFMADFPE